MPRTSTSQSISSSNSSSTIASSYSSSSSSSAAPPANQLSAAHNSYSATSPSSISSSSSSASSSAHHVGPISSSSPRGSRHQSPNHVPSQPQQPFFINGGGPTTTTTISPSGLLTDGPLGRRPTTRGVSGASPLRDRSASPAGPGDNMQQQLSGSRRNLYQQANSGSNSSLHTIQESKIPAKIPTSSSAALAASRRSFLPQPVSYSSGLQQQYGASRQRQSSSSPVR